MTTSASIAQPEADKIGGLARTGVVWSTGLIVARQVLGIGVTAILARLLLPEDYGLLGMVGTLFALLGTVGDLGLSWATIQRSHLTTAQSHNLFWLNASFGVALSIACIAVAPALASFYGDDRLVPVTIVMGIPFALGGVVAQPSALMRRQMQFRELTLIDFATYLVGIIVAITLAFAGAGYWALVAQSLASTMVGLVLILKLSGYRPQLPTRGADTFGLVSFGGYLTVTGFLIYFQRNLDYVLIGKNLGSEELGYYTRAYFLMLLPSMFASGTLGSVMIPSLSALQGHPDRFAAAYRRGVRWIVGVSFPIAAGLALVSHEAVQFVYGSDWLSVVPILTWLSLVSLTQPVYNTYGWLFTASGKGRGFFITNLGTTVVLALAFMGGLRWGAVGVAASYALAMSIVVTLPVLLQAHRAAGIPFGPTLHAIMPAAVATVVMATGVAAIDWMLGSMQVSWMIELWLKVMVGAAIYLPLWLALDSQTRIYLTGILKGIVWRPSFMS